MENTNKTLRQKMNDFVRTNGNKIRDGLGDLLTMNCNFRTVGGITGGIGVPLAVNYAIAYYNMPDQFGALIMTPMAAVSFFPLTFIEIAVGAAAGYQIGEKVDCLIGDYSRRNGLMKSTCMPSFRLKFWEKRQKDSENGGYWAK